ncbi:hypothetical protein PHMEG_00029278 [Phytophthora megakarya]|uniref:Reverse transcriptase n=1 Tax=Phytophthora megakarya TaxID=4795 RepID=A0A225V3M0_9STRA|nr:hypothetical protein PHMEG_00029278 [Phytophthora megakarya]
MPKVEYLDHNVSHNELETNTKDLSAFTDLEFPGFPRDMQTFLGSLNYYSRFIENHALYAYVLYQLREIDYAAMEKGVNRSWIQLALISKPPEPEILTQDPTSSQPPDSDLRSPDLEPSQPDPNLVSWDPTLDRAKVSDPEKDNFAGLDPRWIHAHSSFKMVKEKIATTPILRHFDQNRQAVVVYDQTYYPVIFASPTLKSTELNYGIAEKEVFALLRILDPNYNTSNVLQGRLGQWAALLSPWILEIVKCSKAEDKILDILDASITPRSELDKALISIAPKKEPRRKIQAPTPTPDDDLYVASFDGSVRVKRGTAP